jgi:hypothetical protein
VYNYSLFRTKGNGGNGVLVLSGDAKKDRPGVAGWPRLSAEATEMNPKQ